MIYIFCSIILAMPMLLIALSIYFLALSLPKINLVVKIDKDKSYGIQETNYQSEASVKEGKRSISVPELAPELVAPSLKKPPRPPGGFGTTVSDSGGHK